MKIKNWKRKTKHLFSVGDYVSFDEETFTVVAKNKDKDHLYIVECSEGHQSFLYNDGQYSGFVGVIDLERHEIEENEKDINTIVN